MMKYLKTLLAAVVAAITLIGCTGGGGGAGGTTTTTPEDLRTTAPSAVTIPLGVAGAQTYTISGGTPPYVATSANVSLVTAAVSGGSSVTLTGVAIGGPTSVVVSDSAGKTVTVAVTVGSNTGVALYSNAPSAFTIGVGSAPSYTISGGSAPYTANSTNTSIVSATITGSTLTVTGKELGTGSIVVTDSLGANLTLAVTVGSNGRALKIENAGTISLPQGYHLRLLVTGGKKPYSPFSTFPEAATVTLLADGETIDILAKVPADPATITVRDADGTTVSQSFKITAGGLSFRLAPFVATVAALSTNPVSYTIDGGVGPYKIYSSDETLATVSAATVGAAGATTATFTVTASAVKTPAADTNVLITVIDSQGAIAQGTFTVVVPAP